MPLQIDQLTLGMVQTHCYVVGDPSSGDAVIIDPAAHAPTILETVRVNGWRVREIWITHAHFDHVLALGDVKAATNAPIRMNSADLEMLNTLPQRAQQFLGQWVPMPPHPELGCNAGDKLQLGSVTFEVRYTPGHTPGHVSFVNHADRVVFSGDCLFAGSIGRTDLPGADYRTLIQSIRGQLLTLPDDYRVAAGHMQYTTIGHERATNPFLLADA